MIKIHDIDKYLEAEQKLRDAEIWIDRSMWAEGRNWIGLTIDGDDSELLDALRRECMDDLVTQLQGLMPVMKARIAKFLDNKRAEIKGKLQNDIEKL